MIFILALLLGLLSWTLLIYALVKGKKITKNKKSFIKEFSWILCSFTLYIPSLCQYLADDTSTVLDCVSAYYYATTCLLVVELVLTIILAIREKSNIQ